MTALLLVGVLMALAATWAVVWATHMARQTVELPDGSRGTKTRQEEER